MHVLVSTVNNFLVLNLILVSLSILKNMILHSTAAVHYMYVWRVQTNPSPVQPTPKYVLTHPQINLSPIQPIHWRLSAFIIHILIRWICVDSVNQHV